MVGREARSFQQWIARLPVRLGGFGFLSHKDTASVAFIGAVEQAIPAFQGERGICPQLADKIGGDDCFGEDAGENRWRVMLSSGCREGEELRRAWSSLQEEERQAANWLGEEMQENISAGVEDVGGSSCDGSTRGKMGEERDVTWARLVKKGLEVHPRQDRTNRPVWAWLQRDKLSAAWLQALPGQETSLTSAKFSEAAAAAFCLPSPACADRLGQVIRGAEVVDLYGETVQCTITTGDHYRKRNDSYKMRLLQMCQWAGMDAEVEVFNLFAGWITQ